MRKLRTPPDGTAPTRAGLCDATDWLVHDLYVPLVVKDRQHAGRARYQRPTRPGRTRRPRARRTARSSARSGDSGDSSEPEPPSGRHEAPEVRP